MTTRRRSSVDAISPTVAPNIACASHRLHSGVEVTSFQGALSHPERGEGVAAPPLLLDDGRVNVAVCTVLMFPPI